MTPDSTTRFLDALDRHPKLTLVIMAAVLCAIRSIGILNEGFWWDEASTANLAMLGPEAIIDWSAENQNPPLYFLLVSGWSAVLGVSEIGLRSFSLLLSVATGLVLYRLAHRHVGRESALLAFLLYAGSGIGLYYAQEARSYTLTTLLCTFSFLLYLDLFRQPRTSRAILLGLTNLAAAFVHFTSIPVLLVQPLVAGLFFRRRTKSLRLYFISQFVAASAFLPWVGNLARNTPVAGEYWLSPPDIEAVVDVVLTLAGGPIPASLSGALLLGAAALAARGRLTGVVTRETAWTLALWWLLPIGFAAVVSQWFPIFSPRYLLATTLAFFLVQAALLSALPISPLFRLLIAGTIACAGLFAPQPVKYVKPDWRNAAVHIESARGPRTAIAVTPGGRCLPLAWYLLPEEFAQIRPLGMQSLRAEGVFCLSGEEDIAALARTDAARLVLVVGRGDFRSPETVVAALPGREWHLRNRQDLEGVVILQYDGRAVRFP